jgi:hypothetical protein
MKVFRYNRWLVLVIFVGLLAALVINVQRNTEERQNMTVDLAIDYEGLVELAEREGQPPAEVLRQAKEAGITSLAVYETTFKKLNANGKASATPGSAILERYQSGALTSPAWRELVQQGKIVATEVYVTGHDAQTFREVKADLIRRLGADRVRPFAADGEEVLAVKANYEAFLKMNLGLPTDEMKAVNAAGFYVIARPSNYLEVTNDDVQAVFQRLDGIRVSEIVFSGSEVLGAPKTLSPVVREFRERNITLGMIEDTTQLQFYKQAGLMELAKALDYRAARLYTIPKDEQVKLKLDAAVERWANTDEERNIRIDLLRIYEKPATNMTLLETNMKYFAATRDLLQQKGFQFGPAGTFAPFVPNRILRALIMAGVAAAAVLYLSLIWPGMKPKYQYALLLVLAAAAMGPVLMGHGAKIRLAAALASANLFPALAVIWQLDRIRMIAVRPKWSVPRFIVTALLALFVAGAVSYVGAAYVSGSLADVEYLLEVNIFRGIKLTFLLPILLVAVAFLQRFDVFDGKMDDAHGVLEQLKKILDLPVKVKTLLALFAVLVAGVVFVARSGHTMGMPVSSLELRFRAFLEQAMYARPRSKELLIGHPVFMLAALAWYHKWPTMLLFALVMVATIGQGSMVETFAHMRTPVFMSFVRGIGGIVMGGLLGAAAMVAVEVWQYLISAAKEHKAEE